MEESEKRTGQPGGRRARRGLVLVVAPEGPFRRATSARLIDHGYSVVMCPGPPRCPLMRGERCGLPGTARVAVVLLGSSTLEDPALMGAIGLCSGQAGAVVIVDESGQVPPPVDRIRAGPGFPAEIVRAAGPAGAAAVVRAVEGLHPGPAPLPR